MNSGQDHIGPCFCTLSSPLRQPAQLTLNTNLANSRALLTSAKGAAWSVQTHLHIKWDGQRPWGALSSFTHSARYTPPWFLDTALVGAHGGSCWHTRALRGPGPADPDISSWPWCPHHHSPGHKSDGCEIKVTPIRGANGNHNHYNNHLSQGLAKEGSARFASRRAADGLTRPFSGHNIKNLKAMICDQV